MPSKDYKTASKSQIPTPVKIVRQITISPKTKRENCVVYNKQTTSTDLAINLELKLEIVLDVARYPNIICRNCKDRLLTVKKEK